MALYSELEIKDIVKIFSNNIISGKIKKESDLIKGIYSSYIKGGIDEEQANNIFKAFNLNESIEKLRDSKELKKIAKLKTCNYTQSKIINVIESLYINKTLTDKEMFLLLLSGYYLKVVKEQSINEVAKRLNLEHEYNKLIYELVEKEININN